MKLCAHSSSFNMDAFKRVYSNEDIATKAIPYFWENFDKEGWSIWKADYDYNDELKMIFMSSNLVSGMLQRIDKLRKTAFASVLIIGEDGNNRIEGVWVMRGQELAFSVSGWGCGFVYVDVTWFMWVWHSYGWELQSSVPDGLEQSIV